PARFFGLSCLLFACRAECCSFRRCLVFLRLLGFLFGFRGLTFSFGGLGLLLGLRSLGTALVVLALLRSGQFGRGSLGLLLGLRGLGTPLIILALLGSGEFGLLLLGFKAGGLGSLRRGLAVGTGLILALLGGFLQNIHPLLGIDRQRRIREPLDKFLQHHGVRAVLHLVPLNRFLRRGLATGGGRRRWEGGENDVRLRGLAWL